VISIEPLASSSSTGSSAAGATGSAGASGAGQAYRVTLRMDDGSTQVVSQATTPSYRSGDRVSLSGGTISR
jgi:outer membrane lipoprotein SlyB